MSVDQDVNLDQDVVSSTPSAQDVTVADEVTPAQPSSASDEKPTDILSVVRDVVKKDDEKAPASSAEPAKEEGVQPEPEATDQKDTDNRGPVPYHRFQEVSRKAKQYQEAAGKYEGIQNFLTSTGVSEAEAADTLKLLALSKANPALAWEQFRPFAEDLARRAGLVLEGDLLTQVQNGELPRDVALKLSQAEAKARSFEQQRVYEQEVQVRRQETQLQQELTQTVLDWKADREAKDPYFSAKTEAIQMSLNWIERNEGYPATPEQMKSALKRAYDYANKVVAAPAPAQPRPNARPVVPVRGGQVAGNASPQPPATMLELVKRVGRGQ